MIVNGFNVCGHDWPSSWCNHQCGRAVGHAAEGGHWCGFCGNPQLPPGVSLRRAADAERLGMEYDTPPPDFREIDGSPGPDGLADAADDLLESSGAEPATMDDTFRIGCPDCRGRSPTVEEMSAQLRDSGDTSGACSTCNNTHWIAAPRADWTLAGGGTECPECHGGGFTGRGTGYDDVCSFCGGGGRVRVDGGDEGTGPDGSMAERYRRKALAWFDREVFRAQRMCEAGIKHAERSPRWCEHDECNNGIDYEDRMSEAGTVVHYPPYVHWPICRADAVAARTKLERFRRRAWMRLQRPAETATARRAAAHYMFSCFCALTCMGGSEDKQCPCRTPDDCMMRDHPSWSLDDGHGLVLRRRPTHFGGTDLIHWANDEIETNERPF